MIFIVLGLQVVEEFENMLQSQKNIKMVIFDHITSASAVVMPVKKLAALCRKYNVISVVDGAHAPGQMYLQVESYGVDVYIGNLNYQGGHQTKKNPRPIQEHFKNKILVFKEKIEN